MSCEPFRDALSARLDGESPGMPDTRLDAHLAGCAPCRAWADAAAEVTRRARLVPAEPVPDVAAAVLAALPADRRPGPRRWADAAGLRLALLAVGAGQLAVGLSALTGGGGAVAAAAHLTHETAAWNLGLAACFLVVAARPRLAAGSLPFLLPFTAVLGWVTVGDLGAGHVPAERAAVHLLLVAGALIVSLLALRGRTTRRGPAGTRTPRRAAAPRSRPPQGATSPYRARRPIAPPGAVGRAAARRPAA